MSIGENLKILREKYDLTQQELAEIAGVTNKAVSAWETGQKEPRMGAIEKIAKKFNLKKSNLIEDGGMNFIDLNEPKTLAAYLKDEDYSKEEVEEILKFAEYLKSKRI
ncbi:transcriptional regulator with XRE-family HTH domain [Fontibacillus solani]|uniref:Transcriptional regulator with XRE-family HTH domain n=1 Tax=Fontibacillus solani TaxID=1572857 RepID=A0A7W3SVF1_9BACL|nr:helix-turn-helix transcriptional regulator [Fontibacillus solani]MBA9086986.1 transcriptional regulator with XRE-family HTH domain [Fontibacillus solani]